MHDWTHYRCNIWSGLFEVFCEGWPVWLFSPNCLLVFVSPSCPNDDPHGSEKRGNCAWVEWTCCSVPSWYLQMWLEGNGISCITRGPLKPSNLVWNLVGAELFDQQTVKRQPCSWPSLRITDGAVHPAPPDHRWICSPNWSPHNKPCAPVTRGDRTWNKWLLPLCTYDQPSPVHVRGFTLAIKNQWCGFSHLSFKRPVSF